MTTDSQLRRGLTDRMKANGSLRTKPWEAAVQAIPRHAFLRGGFFRQVEGSIPSAWAPVQPDSPDWLASCYEDTSLVTQIAGTIVPADIRGEILRLPTSSSTLPSLVVRMLEDLQVEDGMRVLEIGTGTGYSAALMSHRLGADLVTSIEYDQDVATRARAALGSVGQFPALVTGDGLLGHSDGQPYDRVIATCGVHTVPLPWIEQTRPGGQILTTIGGWLGSSELVRLTVAEDGTASGPVLGGQVSFMFARPQLPPLLGMLPDLEDGETRTTRISGDVLDEWTSRFVVQLAAPRTQRITLPRGDVREQVLLDVEAGSWAALSSDGDSWTVRQGGPDRVWDAVERTYERWLADGAPPLERFTVRVGRDGQQITW